MTRATSRLAESEILYRGRADYLGLLAAFQARHHEWHFLMGVHVEPCKDRQGCILTATDGQVLGAIYDASARARRSSAIWPISREAAKACLKTHEHTAEVEIGGGSLRILVAGGDAPVYESACERIQANWPDWPRVVPRSLKKRAPNWCFDPALLTRFKQLGAPLRIHPVGPAGPAVIRAHAYPEFYGLIMPMADTDRTPQAAPPEWIPPARWRRRSAR